MFSSMLLQVSGWLESYRTLLDQWTMFTERAELDIALTSAGCNNTPCQQVSIEQLIIIITNIPLLPTAGVRVLPLLRQVHLALVQGDAQGRPDRQPVQAGRGRRRQQAQDSVLSSLQGGE